MRQESETNVREWWPLDYCDEGMPPGMATPGAWLRAMPNGDGWTIASPYYDDEQEEAERKWTFKPLANGERVEFIFCEQLASFDAMIDPDGRFEPHGAVPPNANWFWDDAEHGEESASGDTLEEFARAFVEYHHPTEPERVTVGCSHWSQGYTYSVKIEGDVATLEEAGTA
jgi:hypothetical protein